MAGLLELSQRGVGGESACDVLGGLLIETIEGEAAKGSAGKVSRDGHVTGY